MPRKIFEVDSLDRECSGCELSAFFSYFLSFSHSLFLLLTFTMHTHTYTHIRSNGPHKRELNRLYDGHIV